MLKALIKKQLLELYGNYRQGKNGKRRSRKGMIGYAVLMVVLMLVLLGAFSAISIGLGLALIPSGNAWLFFSILGLMALVMGVFGDVFSTYSALYHAKDNDFMLSLPIPPSTSISHSGLFMSRYSLSFFIFGSMSAMNF